MKITRENYQSLTWNEDISFDDYHQFLNSLNTDEKVESLMFILGNYPEYDDEWIHYYFEIAEEQEQKGEWEKLGGFADFLRENSPTVYQKEFNYLDSLPTIHAFISGDAALGKKRFQQTIDNPEHAVDDTLRRVFALLSTDRNFHDYCKTVAQKVWKPLEQSDRLIGGAEFEYSCFLYGDFLEGAFDKIKDGTAVDWQAFEKNVVAINFKYVPELQQLPDVVTDLDLKKFNTNHTYRNEKLNEIGLEFFYTAYVNYNIPVYWAFRAYFDFMQYCLGDEDAKKRKNWLLFTPKMIDRAIGSMIGMLGTNRAAAYAMTWIIPYLYDFFLQKGFISEADYGQMMGYYQFPRRELMKFVGNKFWCYQGLYSWKKPLYITEENYAKEQGLAKNSINQSREEAEQDMEAYLYSLPKIAKSAIPPKPKPLFNFASPKADNLSLIKPKIQLPKIGRNEKVTVKYKDGTVKKDIKFKKVIKDLEAGKCELV